MKRVRKYTRKKVARLALAQLAVLIEEVDAVAAGAEDTDESQGA